MAEIKLPDWTGDPDGAQILRVGKLRAVITPHILEADGLGFDVWRATDAVGHYLLQSAPGQGLTFGVEWARAICEAVIRQAMLADAAEKRVRDLEQALTEADKEVQRLQARLDELTA